MKSSIILFITVLSLTSCSLNYAPLEQVKPKITIFTPSNNTIIASDFALITGKVAPGDAIITIDDIVVTTSDGQFSYTAQLKTGLNLIKIQAKRNDQWDLELLSLEKSIASKYDWRDNLFTHSFNSLKTAFDIPDKKVVAGTKRVKQDPNDSQTEYKNSAKPINYKVLIKDIAAHKGEIIYAKGKITQVLADGEGEDLYISITNKGYGFWEDSILVYYPAKTDFVKDDIVQAWGDLIGPYSYISQAGWNITVPAMKAAILTR